MNRRSFFSKLSGVCAVVALAPQLAFRTPIKNVVDWPIAAFAFDPAHYTGDYKVYLSGRLVVHKGAEYMEISRVEAVSHWMSQKDG